MLPPSGGSKVVSGGRSCVGGRLKREPSQEVRVEAPKTWTVFLLLPWVSWWMVVGNQ